MSSERGLVLSPQEKIVLTPLQKYLGPEAIKGLKEVVINEPGEIGFEDMDGVWTFKKDPELDFQRLMDIMTLLAEKMNLTFNLAAPILSFRMPGGHRAQVVGGTQNPKKFSMTIRLFQERQFGMEDYMMDQADRDAIVAAVKNAKTILISGGTGSGKTSFMNAVLKFIPHEERLVTLEDVRELKVDQHNWIPFLFAAKTKDDDGPTVTDILNACLRMRPDRIIMGEIRQENAFTFCSAINTGHAGSMATIHANDPKSALDAVINRIMLNGDVSDTAIEVLKKQLVNDIYGVAQLTRVKGGVEGYFQVLDPDRAKRDEEDRIKRIAENKVAAAALAEKSAALQPSTQDESASVIPHPDARVKLEAAGEPNSPMANASMPDLQASHQQNVAERSVHEEDDELPVEFKVSDG